MLNWNSLITSLFSETSWIRYWEWQWRRPHRRRHVTFLVYTMQLHSGLFQSVSEVLVSQSGFTKLVAWCPGAVDFSSPATKNTTPPALPWAIWNSGIKFLPVLLLFTLSTCYLKDKYQESFRPCLFSCGLHGFKLREWALSPVIPPNEVQCSIRKNLYILNNIIKLHGQIISL